MTQLPATPLLETASLWLKPLAMRDAPAIQRRFPRWEIVQYLSAGVPWPYPPDGAQMFLHASLADMAAGTHSKWGIWLKGGPDELIGIIEIWIPDETTRDSRGFWLDPDFQGRGLMTQAADRVVDYAFDELGWPFLWLGNAKANVASARVKERQGAVLIDEVPFMSVGGACNRQVWLLEATHWFERRKAKQAAAG